MSAAVGFPSAAMKALDLDVCGLFTTIMQAKVHKLQKDRVYLSFLLCFELQSPEHPESSSTISGFRQCFVNHLKKIV